MEIHENVKPGTGPTTAATAPSVPSNEDDPKPEARTGSWTWLRPAAREWGLILIEVALALFGAWAVVSAIACLPTACTWTTGSG
jgi:hypothetical protein